MQPEPSPNFVPLVDPDFNPYPGLPVPAPVLSLYRHLSLSLYLSLYLYLYLYLGYLTFDL